MKKIIMATFFLSVSVHPFAQSKEAGTDRDAIKQFMNNKNTMPALSQSNDANAIKKISWFGHG